MSGTHLSLEVDPLTTSVAPFYIQPVHMTAAYDSLCAGEYISLDTKLFISAMLFSANLLTGTEQTKSKPGEQPHC